MTESGLEGLEIGDRSEHAAFQSPLCQGREKTFDSVEPRCRGGREVKGPAGMAGEPLADLRMFMGGVIVDDRLDRLSRWSPLLDGVEEANELLMAMALHVAADDCAVEQRPRRTSSACSFKGSTPISARVIFGFSDNPIFETRRLATCRSSTRGRFPAKSSQKLRFVARRSKPKA